MPNHRSRNSSNSRSRSRSSSSSTDRNRHAQEFADAITREIRGRTRSPIRRSRSRSRTRSRNRSQSRSQGFNQFSRDVTRVIDGVTYRMPNYRPLPVLRYRTPSPQPRIDANTYYATYLGAIRSEGGRYYDEDNNVIPASIARSLLY